MKCVAGERIIELKNKTEISSKCSDFVLRGLLGLKMKVYDEKSGCP